MTAQTKTTSDLYFNSVLLYAERRGLPPAQVLAAIDAEDLLTHKPPRVPLDYYTAALAYCAAQLSDPLFGFHLGQDIRAADFGILGYLVETGENLQQAIQSLLRYDALVADIGVAQFLVEGPSAVVRWQPYNPTNSQVILRNMTAWVATARQLLGPQLSPVSLALTTKFTGQELEELTFWFGCAVSANQAHNELRFPTEFLAVPFSTENSAMHSNLLQLSEFELQKQAGTPSSLNRVQQVLQLKSDLQDCNLNQLARALNLSPRTLQRRLKATNTSFSQLLDEERRRRAEHLMTHMKLGALAAHLGFNEQSSFNRAFKRWFGCAPSKFKLTGRTRN